MDEVEFVKIQGNITRRFAPLPKIDCINLFGIAYYTDVLDEINYQGDRDKTFGEWSQTKNSELVKEEMNLKNQHCQTNRLRNWYADNPHKTLWKLTWKLVMFLKAWRNLSLGGTCPNKPNNIVSLAVLGQKQLLHSTKELTFIPISKSIY